MTPLQTAMKNVDEEFEKLEKSFKADPLKPGSVSSSPAALTSERGKTHGSWHTQANTAQALKSIFRDRCSAQVTKDQREAIEMILVKISRIITGNPNEADHWDDIAGYAHLGKTGDNG